MLEYQELDDILAGISLDDNQQDVVVWPYSKDKMFSVKSCYLKLVQGQKAELANISLKHALTVMWETNVPSKVKIFGWRLFHDRLPTRMQLVKRGILQNEHHKPVLEHGRFAEETDVGEDRSTASGTDKENLAEVIHWLVYNYETKSDVIFAFDVKKMRMSETALPDYYVVNHTSLALEGLISSWNMDVRSDTIEIWVMQAAHSSWTKTLVLSMHPAPYFATICFTNYGDIIGTNDEDGSVKFDDKGQLVAHNSHSYYC
ncbi:unnamed protein product [Vicia faba]|uniref:Reverse transcriptase zinc-binding domain-containing protein n=1 Tax=Vicia faba TaxID=3906 RepID=A0AAV1ARZ2_VICFA|nr:unnamed protein product [Vicia faba]